MTTRQAFSGLMFTALALLPRLVTAQATGGAKVEQQVLLTGGRGVAFAISPKGQHLAAAVLRGSRTVVVYDGVDGPRLDEILPTSEGQNVVFSTDGSHYGYVGRQGDEYVVMVDGKELARGGPWMVPGLPFRTMDAFDFAPEGKHFWYRTHSTMPRAGQVWQLHVDAQPPEPPATNSDLFPVFTPDGEHHAEFMNVVPPSGPASQVLFVDGKPAPYRGGAPQWTTDGLHLFTSVQVPRLNAIDLLLDGRPFLRAANVQLQMAPVGSAVAAVVGIQSPTGPQSFLAIGNKKVAGSDCTQILGVFFSSDGRHFALTCESTPTDYWVMVDGKKGQQYQHVSRVAFTADGRAVYQSSMNGKTFVVVGDQESDAYQGIVPYATSKADQAEQSARPVPAVVVGNHVGYIALPAQSMGNNKLVVVDGKSIAAPAASDLRFSPDGSHYAYVTNSGVVEDGTPIKGMGFSGALAMDYHKLAFSPDGKHLAFPAFPAPDNSKHGMGIDGKYFATDGMMPYGATFTPDGKHLFWMARSLDAAREFIYLDGEKLLEVGQSAGLENDTDAWSSVGSDGALTFIGQDGDSMKRFRITPGTTSVEGLLARAR